MCFDYIDNEGHKQVSTFPEQLRGLVCALPRIEHTHGTCLVDYICAPVREVLEERREFGQDSTDRLLHQQEVDEDQYRRHIIKPTTSCSANKESSLSR